MFLSENLENSRTHRRTDEKALTLSSAARVTILPALRTDWQGFLFGAVVLYLISSSNHNYGGDCYRACSVVLYLISSSNHNELAEARLEIDVVLYLISSSNHNIYDEIPEGWALFFISFHHQTTTDMSLSLSSGRLFFISFHHQTTTLPMCCTSRTPLFFISFHHQTTTLMARLP